MNNALPEFIMEENKPLNETAVLVFSKAPVEGQVKTRLISELGARGACELHTHLLQRTLDMLMQVEDCDLQLWWAGDIKHSFLSSPWLKKISIKQQVSGDLGERMRHACEETLQQYQQVIVIGTDCAVMTAEHLMEVKQQLQHGTEVVITPAEDGGYVLVAMREYVAEVFHNIAWGTASVFTQTRTILEQLDINWLAMPCLWDVDREADLLRLRESGSLLQFDQRQDTVR